LAVETVVEIRRWAFDISDHEAWVGALGTEFQARDDPPLNFPTLGRIAQLTDVPFSLQTATQDNESRRADFDRLLASLTPREKEVMDLVVTGRHNREIAEVLGISARTVEVHKARMMTKLGVDGVPDLVRLSLVGHDKNSI